MNCGAGLYPAHRFSTGADRAVYKAIRAGYQPNATRLSQYTDHSALVVAGNLVCGRLSGGLFGSCASLRTWQSPAESRRQPELAAPQDMQIASLGKRVALGYQPAGPRVPLQTCPTVLAEFQVLGKVCGIGPPAPAPDPWSPVPGPRSPVPGPRSPAPGPRSPIPESQQRA